MTGEEIKQECEKMYAQIKEAEEKLKELRSICNHEKKYQSYYSWRIGSFAQAIICEYCGTPVSFIGEFIEQNTTPIYS